MRWAMRKRVNGFRQDTKDQRKEDQIRNTAFQVKDSDKDGDFFPIAPSQDRWKQSGEAQCPLLGAIHCPGRSPSPRCFPQKSCRCSNRWRFSRALPSGLAQTPRSPKLSPGSATTPFLSTSKRRNEMNDRVWRTAREPAHTSSPRTKIID